MQAATSEKIYEPQAWRLDDLFPSLDSPELEAAVADLDEAVDAFEARRDLLSPDIDSQTFLEMLDAYEDVYQRYWELVIFASMCFESDTQDTRAQAAYARMRALKAQAVNRTLFFELWWKGLEQETVERLLPPAGDRRYWLETLRRQRPYTLPEAQEQIINTKNATCRQGLTQLYGSITGRYRFRLTADGTTREMAERELISHYSSSDAAAREAAYCELLRVYGADAALHGQIFQALVRDWRSEKMEARAYPSPIAVKNVENDVPDEVAALLLDVIAANRTVFQRYFRLKAGWLGMPRLRRYDVYAPVTRATDTFSFDQAAKLVLASYRAFEPRFGDLLQRIFDEQHFHAADRPGKSSLCFCTVPRPDITPWVHQTYFGKTEDVATMAHELGHGLHGMLAAGHGSLSFWPSLPVAETASIFGEMLLTDYLLQRNAAPEVRRALLCRQVERAYATIMRQGYFARFEIEAHRLVAEGVRVDDINDLYLSSLQEQFGDAVDVSDDFRHEWLMVSHFFEWPFYVYAYSFGHLLVMALYDQYRREGEPFKQRYIDLLAAGGSAGPEELLARAGFDIHDRAFWQGGFDQLATVVDELEAMPAPDQAKP